MQKNSLNCGEKHLLRVGIAIPLAILTLSGYYEWANRVPNLQVPQSKTSATAAFVYYQKAIQASFAPLLSRGGKAGIDLHIDENKWRQPNPVRLYSDAYNRTYPLAPKIALLAQNAKALRLFRQGLKFSEIRLPEREPAGFYDKFYRGLGRILLVEAHVHAQHGDWDSAADTLLDLMKFGYDSMRGGSVESAQWGNVFRQDAAEDLKVIIAHLSAPKARLVAQSIEGWQQNRVTSVTTLAEEKQSKQRLLLHLIKSRDLRPLLVGARYINPDAASLHAYNERVKGLPALVKMRLDWMEKSQLLAEYTRCMDWQIAEAKKPYHLRSKDWPFKATDDLGSYIIHPDYRFLFESADRHDTQDLLIMTQCAIHAFYKEQGRYPRSLRELVPRYLTKIPRDPFSDNQQLGYQLKPVKYIAYVWYRQSPAIQHNVLNTTAPEALDFPPEPEEHVVYQTHPFTLYSRGYDRHDNGGMTGKETGKHIASTPQSDMVAGANY